MTILEYFLLVLTACVGVSGGLLMCRWWHWLVWAFVVASVAFAALFFKGDGIVYGVALFCAVALIPPAVSVHWSMPKAPMLMHPMYMLAAVAALWDACILFYLFA